MKPGYVLGFLFSEDLSQVVLIRKTKPDWQAGKLNGVGGKIENGEECRWGAHLAMAREFEEETGVATDYMCWNCFAQLEFPEAIVVCFARRSSTVETPNGKLIRPEIDRVQTTTDEEIARYATTEHDSIWENRAYWGFLPHMPNLEWLIPMARQSAHYRDNEYIIKARRLS